MTDQLKLKEVNKIINNLRVQIDSYDPDPYEATLEQLGERMKILLSYKESLK